MNKYESLLLDDFYGEGLRRRREAAGLSVEEMANRMDTTVWCIYDYENGHRMPGIEIAIEMYNLTGCRICMRTNESRAVRLGITERATFIAIFKGDMYGEGLKERREEAGLTVLDLAKALGRSQRTVQRYESGDRKPSVHDAVVMYNVIQDALWHKEYR